MENWLFNYNFGTFFTKQHTIIFLEYVHFWLKIKVILTLDYEFNNLTDFTLYMTFTIVYLLLN